MREEQPGTVNNQALARGLHILKVLVDENEPMTATEIARRFGLHQSSISRVLATLTELGYVRKAANRRFVPDYGVLSLASATSQFPLVRLPRTAMEEIAAAHPGMIVSLCMLWREQMIYFLRTSHSTDTIEFWGPGFPVHLSSPGMRMLSDLPDATALEILTHSRERYGWDGIRPQVPQTERAILTKARKLVSHDVLILDEWFQKDNVGGAIPIETNEEHPVALALTGPRALADDATLRLWLHDARRIIEGTLNTTNPLQQRGAAS